MPISRWIFLSFYSFPSDACMWVSLTSDNSSFPCMLCCPQNTFHPCFQFGSLFSSPPPASQLICWYQTELPNCFCWFCPVICRSFVFATQQQHPGRRESEKSGWRRGWKSKRISRSSIGIRGCSHRRRKSLFSCIWTFNGWQVWWVRSDEGTWWRGWWPAHLWTV